MNRFILIFIVAACFSLVASAQVALPAASPGPLGSSLEKYKNRTVEGERENAAKENTDDSETIVVRSELVLNEITVSDRNGRSVSGLKKEDFSVTENLVAQTIDVFSTGEDSTIPRSLVLILDCTGAQVPYIRSSIEASKLFVENLGPSDKMAIVTSDLRIQMGFTTDKAVLNEVLDRIGRQSKQPGSGLEFDTLLAVLNEMFNKQDRRRMIIFQGDGNEIIWLKRENDNRYRVSNSTMRMSGIDHGSRTRSFSFADIEDAIARTSATIYSVIPGVKFFGLPKSERLARARTSFEIANSTFGWRLEKSPILMRDFYEAEAERRTVGQSAMFDVAELSGGTAHFFEKPGDATKIYTSIFSTFKSRYVIGYYPSDQSETGKLINLKITVVGHPEYIITGRKSYLR